MRTVKLSQPYITEQAIDRVADVLRSGWLTQGPVVAEFEKAFADYTNTSCSLAVSSATSGLHITMLALEIGPGDEVIVPAFTWVATANAVELCGGKTVLVDIDPTTFNTTIEKVIAKITEKTKAIVIVHLFGKPFDTQALIKALPRSIPVIEDSACAAGANLNGKQCGTIGQAGIYSFHPRKSITTGEGGMIVTADNILHAKTAMLRNHGQDTSYRQDTPSFMYDCPVAGLNCRMTDIQGALGLEQLREIDMLIEQRNILANRYTENLEGQRSLTLPRQDFGETHAWQSYIATLDNKICREAVMEHLKKSGIETRPGTHALHILKYYKEKYNLHEADFPVAYNAHLKSIALPLHNHMNIDDVDYVSEKLKEALNA